MEDNITEKSTRIDGSERVDFSVMLSPISFFENQVKSNRKIDPLGDPDRVDFQFDFRFYLQFHIEWVAGG